MAAVLEVGIVASTAAAATGRPLQGVAVSSSQVAASPFRLYGSHGSAAHRTVLPTCRGLKLNLVGASRLPAAVVRASPASKGIVCEAQETAVGLTRLEHGAAGVVSDQTFQKLVLESDVPVLVDFWAPWCGPCRMIAPIIDELARQYAGKIRCLKLNTDESPYIATEYGIRSIPTVMIFKRGEKKDTVIGAVPKSTLTATIEKYLD